MEDWRTHREGIRGHRPELVCSACSVFLQSIEGLSLRPDDGHRVTKFDLHAVGEHERSQGGESRACTALRE